MPILGLGTWKSLPEKAGLAVEYALECGYRHIDCAAIYNNEKEIGQSFKRIFAKGNIKREEVFITSKLWNNSHAKDDVPVACKATLDDLQIDFLDLYLMHWGVATPRKLDPQPLDQNGRLILAKVSIRETWEAMEGLVKKGLVKAIGVSNFTGPMLIDLLSYASIKPALNQIELHPYNTQVKLLEFCNYQNIAVTAYSPLGSPGNMEPGEPVLLEDKQVVAIARNYNKSAAQVLIKWAIQRGTVVIPKSTTPERIKGNFEVFDFELSQQELDQLTKLDRRLRYNNPAIWWRIPYFD